MENRSLDTKIEVALDQLVRVREDIKSLDTKISQNYATKTEVVQIKQDVAEIKGNITWISRLVIGMVITAVVGTVIIFK